MADMWNDLQTRPKDSARDRVMTSTSGRSNVSVEYESVVPDGFANLAS
jgi:hypothetical protein